MLKNLLSMLVLITLSISIQAADDIPVQDDIGKPGQAARVPKDNEFKVCADQDNMPYSNAAGEGFENKIAEVLAADLGKELSYQFWHDRFGFLRNTLNAKRCDVIIGTNTTYDALIQQSLIIVQGMCGYIEKIVDTNKDWNSPDLRKGVIGIVDKSPVSVALDANDLIGNAKPYRLMRDLTKSPGQLVDHVVSGEIDVAIMWGPIGGYYAKQSKEDLVVVLIPEYADGNEGLSGKTYWNISAGVRKKDDERREMIDAALVRNKDKIRKIMDEFGIPYADPVFADRLDGYKRHKN